MTVVRPSSKKSKTWWRKRKHCWLAAAGDVSRYSESRSTSERSSALSPTPLNGPTVSSIASSVNRSSHLEPIIVIFVVSACFAWTITALGLATASVFSTTSYSGSFSCTQGWDLSQLRQSCSARLTKFRSHCKPRWLWRSPWAWVFSHFYVFIPSLSWTTGAHLKGTHCWRMTFSVSSQFVKSGDSSSATGA